MKLTFNWLKEFVGVRVSPHRLAEALTMAGLEVESLTALRTEGSGEGDWLMEIAVTPNRGDCLGILGLAREVAALTGGKLKLPPSEAHALDGSSKPLVRVKILAPRLCPRYSARVVREVTVRPSPSWMRLRLEACGIRSVNNVVDVTNYVMLESGQPLHAFDLDRLAAKRIIVRRAKEIKKFVTLDGIERELAAEDLLICDGDTPVALAGIMGGRESEVRSDTRAVLVESAHFDPVAVRRTAKRLGLHSEASHRFERGVDPEGTLYALDRAAFLLSDGAGGVPLKGALDRYPRRQRMAPVVLREQRAREILGIELKSKEIERILKSLGCKIQGRAKAGLKIIPPSYRCDLSREADVIEELARIHGYEKIPSTLPLVRPQSGRADPSLRWERGIRTYLVGEGLSEMIDLPFTSGEMNRRFYGLSEGQGSPVSILNPLVRENAEMRLSLIPGLAEDLRVNLAQRIKGLGGFALGKVFSLAPNGSPHERRHLAALLYGLRGRTGLRVKEEPFAFLDIKGLVEGILEWVGAGSRSLWSSCATPSFLHPGKAAWLQLDDSALGYLGEAHPDLCEELALPPFLIFELDFDRLVQYPPRDITVRPLPRFPSVERDMAIVVDEAFRAQQIINWIKDLGYSLIEDVEIFDQYRGAPIPEGKKSLAYRFSYRAEDRTLTDAEVNALHQDLMSKIAEVFGAQPRV
jgi:phenylalanyl-tRNA synthetase beta chain